MTQWVQAVSDIKPYVDTLLRCNRVSSVERQVLSRDSQIVVNQQGRKVRKTVKLTRVVKRGL